MDKETMKTMLKEVDRDKLEDGYISLLDCVDDMAKTSLNFVDKVVEIENKRAPRYQFFLCGFILGMIIEFAILTYLK